MKLVCEIDGCGNELSEHCGSKGGLMICGNCRGSSYYWKKKGVGAARERREKLQLYTHRIEYYEPRVLKMINEAKRTVKADRARANAALHH
jgi:hypothetical protein